MAELVSGPVDAEPLVAREPLQAPDALQVVALELLQVSVAAAPFVTLVGLALNDRAGAGVLATTDTAVD